MLSHAYHSNRYYDNGSYDRGYSRGYRDGTVSGGPTRIIHESAVPGRHLFRDANGNCFDKTVASDGTELLTELPPEACAW